MSNKLTTILVLLMLILLTSSGASAEFNRNSAMPAPALAPIGTTFTYQGYLTDGGSPADGEYDFQFMLFDAASAGSQVGVTTSEENVDVVEGYFTVELDFGAYFDGTALWLEIWVRPGASIGGYQQLLPRQPLTAVPYANYALAAPWSGLSGVPAGFADGVDNDTPYSAGTGLTLSGGAFSLTTPYRLPQGCAIGQITEWNGSAWICAADANSGGDITAVNAGTGLTGGGTSGAVTLNVSFAGSGSATTVARSDQDHWGRTWTGSGTGLYLSGGLTGLNASGTTSGVYGQSSSTSGRGVYGYASAASGTTTGVRGQSASTSGRGVYGYATAASGTTYGVRGESFSTSGRGVYGYATAGNGITYGVYGVSSSTSGSGIRGSANASSGTTYGVYASNYSTSGRGVYAYANATSGTTYGVYSVSASTSGRGVSGFATAASGTTYGVWGVANSTSGRGVYGYGGSSGYDFYAGGPGTNYGPFTGAHEVRLAASFPLDVKAGMIVSATGEAQARHGADGGVEISSTLPTVRLADTAEDKSVFGALVSEVTLPEDHWYEAGEDERFASVNALGEGRVWISNINGGIEAGDYITTSALPGYGQLQNDDLLHSYTLGKATETVNWDKVTETVMYNGQEYEVYLIAVVYTSG